MRVCSAHIFEIKTHILHNCELLSAKLKKNYYLKLGYEFIQKHKYLVLFFGVFLIYNLNFRNINSSDTLPASLLPFVLLNSHTFQFDVLLPFITNGDNSNAFSQIGNHFYSVYPIVTPVLVTPLYVIPCLLLNFLHIPLDMSNSTFFLTVFAMEKISASFISALAIVFFFAGLREMINNKIALITALILAFGTNMWSICSQALWQHGMVALLFSILFFIIVRNEKNEQSLNYFLLGACSGLLFFTRPADSLIIIPVVIYVFYKNIRSFVIFCFMAAISSLPLLYYNLSIFHTIFGGYTSMATGSGFVPELITPSITAELIRESIGLLFSPQLGLFIFTPIALIAILGYFKVTSISQKPMRFFLYSFAPCLIFETLVFALWFWNLKLDTSTLPGIMFGPRYFSGFLPAICIFIGIYLNSLANPGNSKFEKTSLKKFLMICIISLFVAWSVFAQIVGAFYYPNGNWQEFRKFTVDQIGDIADTSILKTFNEGPIIVNPINILQNLKRGNDIIDPSTDFAIKIGTNLDKGWGMLEGNESQPVRAIGNYSSISVQYMKYSLPDNNCTLSVIAQSENEPRTMMIFVNHKFVNNFTIATTYGQNITPVMLKSSLRMGNNEIEFKIPENCIELASVNTSKKYVSDTCIKIQEIKISCLQK